MSDSGWKPAPPDPYWSLPETKGGPPRSAFQAQAQSQAGSSSSSGPRRLPPLPPRAPPPSPFMAKLSVWATIITVPGVIVYSVFYQDFGEGEHIYSPARRWLARQKAAFFTLTPEEQRLVGITNSPPSSSTSEATAAVPVDMEPPAPPPEPVTADPVTTKMNKRTSSWFWRSELPAPPPVPASTGPAETVPVDMASPPAPAESEAEKTSEPKGIDMDKLRERARSRWWGFK